MTAPIFYPGWQVDPVIPGYTWISQRAYFIPPAPIPPLPYKVTIDPQPETRLRSPYREFERCCPPCCPLLQHPRRIVKHPDGTTEIFWDSEK